MYTVCSRSRHGRTVTTSFWPRTDLSLRMPAGRAPYEVAYRFAQGAASIMKPSTTPPETVSVAPVT